MKKLDEIPDKKKLSRGYVELAFISATRCDSTIGLRSAI